MTDDSGISGVFLCVGSLVALWVVVCMFGLWSRAAVAACAMSVTVASGVRWWPVRAVS